MQVENKTRNNQYVEETTMKTTENDSFRGFTTASLISTEITSQTPSEFSSKEEETEASEGVTEIISLLSSKSTEIFDETETTESSTFDNTKSTDSETLSTTYDWFLRPNTKDTTNYDNTPTAVSDGSSDEEITKTSDWKRDATISTSDLIDLDTTETENFVYGLASLFTGRTTPFWTIYSKQDTGASETTETTEISTITTENTSESETSEIFTITSENTSESETTSDEIISEVMDTSENTETSSETTETINFQTVTITVRPETQYNEKLKLKKPRPAYDSGKDRVYYDVTTEKPSTEALSTEEAPGQLIYFNINNDNGLNSPEETTINSSEDIDSDVMEFDGDIQTESIT